MERLRFIKNRTFDEIAVDDTAGLTRTLQAQDISLFALASGDVNPIHLDQTYSVADRFHRVIAQEPRSGSVNSAVLGEELPGPDTEGRASAEQEHEVLRVAQVVFGYFPELTSGVRPVRRSGGLRPATTGVDLSRGDSDVRASHVLRDGRMRDWPAIARDEAPVAF